MPSFIERQLIKLAGKRVRGMDGFKRWAPFVGTLVTVLCAGLRAAGYVDAADAILGVVALALPGVSSEEGALATTAAVSVVGLIAQLKSRYDKAQRQADVVKIR